MKRKLIESYQEDLIVCDNKECDFKVKSETGDINEDCSSYLNVACPKCGENLLTEQDYLQSQNVKKVVNWLNKWFSWIMIFVPKNSKQKTVTVHCHKVIKVEEKSSNP